jgi:hypothetical protein
LPGANGTNGTNGISNYEFRTALTAPFNAQQNFALAPIQIACQLPGNAPISGGYELMNSSAGLNVLSSVPVRDLTLNGWRVTVRNMFTPGTIMSAQVRIHVICGKVD